MFFNGPSNILFKLTEIWGPKSTMDTEFLQGGVRHQSTMW